MSPRPELRSLGALSVLLALPLVLSAPPPVHAESGGNPEVFGESVDVRVINLEVVVTDRDGNRVHDLGPGDFRLRVDGDETPIDYFSEVRSSVVVAEEPAADAGTSTTTRPAPVLAAGESGVVPRSIVVFVDNVFALAHRRDQALAGLRAAIGSLRPGDRLAIVSFDGRELRLVTDWTESGAEMLRGLDRVASAPTEGPQRISELRQFQLLLQRMGSEMIADANRTFLQDYVQRLTRQVESVIRAAATTVRTFGQAPGRKMMILLSGGWPREPLYYARGSDAGIRELDLRSFDLRVAGALDDLTATANLVGTTLYPVDVPQRSTQATSASAAFLPTDPSGGSGPPPGLGSAGREMMIEASLLEIAEETGGEAYLNAEAADALTATLADTASYYWLGFAPERERDDEDHEIRVDVSRKGLDVRVRKGFKDLSRQTEVTMMVESQLLFTSSVGQGLAVQLHQPDRKWRRRLELPVSLLIPLNDVVMLPSDKGYEARLELRVAVIDEDGDRSKIPVIPIEFSGPEAPAPGAHVVYDTSLLLRDEKQRLVLSLYDLAGEGILSTTFELDPAGL